MINGITPGASGLGTGLTAPGMGGMSGMSGMSGMPSPGQGPQPMGESQSFGELLNEKIIQGPSQMSAEAKSLAAAQATGMDIDPHQLAVTTAMAGVEIQMATRTISSVVSGIRMLMQTQI